MNGSSARARTGIRDPHMEARQDPARGFLYRCGTPGHHDPHSREDMPVALAERLTRSLFSHLLVDCWDIDQVPHHLG